MGLVLTGHIVAAAESARFMPKFTPQFALIRGPSCTRMLPRLAGPGSHPRTDHAGGRDIECPAAEPWGLIGRCHLDDEFPGAANALAAQLARGQAFALAALKTAILESPGHDGDQQLCAENGVVRTVRGNGGFRRGCGSVSSQA